jgi:hypothetical protein
MSPVKMPISDQMSAEPDVSNLTSYSNSQSRHNSSRKIRPASPSAFKQIHDNDDHDIEYMPIKVLTTFTRDWRIRARISCKAEKKATKNGGAILKMELVDMYGTQIEAICFG